MTASVREEFLMKMYDQMFSDIDRRIEVTWQSATALVGGLAVVALAEKGVLPIDFGVAIVVLLVGWLLAILLDASYWYNRNLVIIANIERQFLQAADLRNVHYYFGAHRPKNRMITHLRIQSALGIALGSVILLYHFLSRILPGVLASESTWDFQRAVPYVLAVVVGVFLGRLTKRNRLAYEEFIANSPGIKVETGEVKYGVGHGYREGEKPAENP